MRNFETRDFASTEKELEIFGHHKNAEIILEGQGEDRMKIDDFADIYKDEERKDDQKLVTALKRKFEQELDHLSPEEIKKIETGKKKADALEIIVINKGGEYGWFGENTYLVRTTEYDDIINGVDGVLEFEPEEKTDKIRRLALAIDASFRADRFPVQRKINRHTQYLTQRRPPLEVKYFESTIDGSRGKLTKIVPVVVGIEGENLDNLIDLFAQLEKLGDAPQANQTARRLHKEKLAQAKSHPVQIIFLQEIKKQLDYYLRLLQDAQDEESKFYKKEIAKLNSRIQAVIQSKKGIDTQPLMDDKIFRIISDLTKKK